MTMDKIKVKFIRPVGMYRTGETGYLTQKQIITLGSFVEVMKAKRKPAKKAANKSMASNKTVETK